MPEDFSCNTSVVPDKFSKETCVGRIYSLNLGVEVGERSLYFIWWREESLQSETSRLQQMIRTSTCHVHDLINPTAFVETASMGVGSLGDLIRSFRRESDFTCNGVCLPVETVYRGVVAAAGKQLFGVSGEFWASGGIQRRRMPKEYDSSPGGGVILPQHLPNSLRWTLE